MQQVFMCGCGHDGRLGTGAEGNCPALTPITIHPTCHPSQSQSSTHDGRVAVRAVVAGGFHTFFVLENGEVHGCGLNEQGQLGLGSRSHLMAKRPMPIPFFTDRLSKKKVSATQPASEDPRDVSCCTPSSPLSTASTWLAAEVDLVALACGAYHSVAWMADGIYVCGGNEHGQLGLGDFDPRFGFVALATLSVGPTHLHGIGCGTFHTAIVVRDVSATIRVHSQSIAPDSQPPSMDGLTVGAEDGAAGVECLLPFAVLTCGKGDFGELGFDPEAGDTLHATERRVRANVIARAHHAQQGGDTADIPDVVSTMGGGGSGGVRFKPPPSFKRPTVVRRPEFSSPTPRRVPLAFLDAFGIPTSANTSDYPSPGGSAADGAALLAARRGGATVIVTDVTVMPMYHHTVVRVTTAADRGLSAPKVHLFSFGCLYAGAIETLTSSVPTLLPPDTVLVHAGDEVRLRVATSATATGHSVMVLGKGPLGRGIEEDSTAPDTEVCIDPFICAALGQSGEDSTQPPPFEVIAISGKTHFVLLLRVEADVTGDSPSPAGRHVLVSWGDNFMGQLGLGLNAANGRDTADALVPTAIPLPPGAARFVGAAAGFRHTAILASMEM